MPLSENARAAMRQSLEKMIPFVGRSEIQVDELEVGYVKMRMPIEPNTNHVGTMYAGALFTLAEMPGGAIFVTTFNAKKFYPIVKSMDIHYLKPATTDITVEVRLSEEEAAKIAAKAEAEGKADYDWECELKDANGVVVATTTNRYQMRSHGR